MQSLKILHFPSREDYIKYLQKGHVFLSCARSEGWNLPLIEAMACGTPVIASERGALPEVIGKYGYLVNPFDIESIAFAMKAVIKDKKCFEKALYQGPARAASFNWLNTAKEITQIIQKID